MNAIINMELRKNLQDRGLLFWMLILPIIFTVLFISVFTSGMEDAVQKEVVTSIVPGYIVMFVFFFLIGMVSTFIKDLVLGSLVRHPITPYQPSFIFLFILTICFNVLFFSVFTSGMEDSGQEGVVNSIVPGYIVMFLFFIMISMVSTFIKDRDHGIVARLASTPLPPSFYLFGKWIPYMYVVLIQMFILFLFGKLVYNIPLEQPILLVVLSILLTFTVTGLGLALRSEEHTSE